MIPTEVLARTTLIRLHDGPGLLARLPDLDAYVLRGAETPLSCLPGWLSVFSKAFGHVPYCLEAVNGGQTCGLLPLAYVRSFLFGRFLVSLPYLNYGGVQADNAQIAGQLVDEAVALADRLKVRYLELRHQQPLEHPSLVERTQGKVQMRLSLPDSLSKLWDALSPKVRNQVRKGQKNDLRTVWGGEDLLGEFYEVFSRNMRDLGTPVYGRSLFRAILARFEDRAEFCLVRSGTQPVAAALLLHGYGITEVPSASSLREFNPSCANMLMYWNLLERAVQRGQKVFDFGRSTMDGNTYRFKKQWGAQPSPAHWQYHSPAGTLECVRPDNPRYERLIRLWQRMPVWLSRQIGPAVVRGIP